MRSVALTLPRRARTITLMLAGIPKPNPSPWTWRDRPRHIARHCAGCGVTVIGTSLRTFDEARAEHYEQAHGIKRPRS